MDKPKPPEPSPVGVRRRWTLRRLWAVALLTLRQGLRMRLWILAPLAILILVLTDLSATRFDPVFDAVPAAISTSLLVMAVLAVVVGVFMAAFAIPAEIESKAAYTLVTKPVSRAEIVVGRTLGMSLLVAALLAPVGVGAYIYILVRSEGVRTLAAERLREARPRAAHPADLNAMEEAARYGPLLTFRYRDADAGPQAGIHFAPGAVPPSDRLWILGASGMRMSWNLAETPLAEWAAAGPCKLRLTLAAVRPPGTPEEPVEVTVGLLNPQERRRPDQEAAGRPAPVRQVIVTVPASGDVEVPVASMDAPPTKGVLNMPPPGELLLAVLADKDGRLVGAGPRALRMIGPEGHEAAVEAPPEILASEERGGREWLVGRPLLPRQAAVFRFDNVPEGILGAADTAVEIGFFLDAQGPVLEQPAVQATFVKPAGGEERTMVFTPESRRSTLLYIDRAFWHGGPLEVRLECLTADDYLGLLPQSVQLRLGGGPFALHLAKAAFQVWLFGTVLAAAAVAFSTRLSWYVGILTTLVLLMVGMTREFFLKFTFFGDLARIAAKGLGALAAWPGWLDVTQHLVDPIPDLRAMMPGEAVATGRVIPWPELAASFGWAMLGVAVLLAFGTLLFRRREVAA